MEPNLSSLCPDPNGPGGCLAIARYGRLEHLETRGLACLCTATPVGPETNFRLASVSKQFTAAVILLLRQQGRLRLEDPLRRFFPGFPAWGADTITVRHLLQHTSGILDYEDHLPECLEHPLLDEDVLEITQGLSGTYFPPGTEFRYSNTGYALLACIVERVTGLPYPVALEELIFHPLGMTRTVARHDRLRPEVPNRAWGYRKLEDGTCAEADQSPTSSVLGDGGIYCSVNDYLLWDRALWEGTLLPPDVVREMMTPGRLEGHSTPEPGGGRIWFPDDMNEGHPGREGDACVMAGGKPTADGECTIPYGLGWRLETNDLGLAVAYHPGSTTGFMHCVRRVPERGLTILVLANRSVAPSKELAREVEKRMLGAENAGN